MTHAYTVIKGKESITGKHSTPELKIELFCLFNGLSQRIDP
jgi:hypothetical protein